MKIAICSPIHSGGKPAFIQSLARMIDWTHRIRIQDANGEPLRPAIETLVYSSSNVAHSRNRIAAAALEWGADWTLWLDADHSFPPATLVRLLGRGKTVVGANYRRRMTAEVKVTAYVRDGDRLAPLALRGDGVEPVHSLGLGVCLIHASVFRKIEQPYFAWGLAEDGVLVGEDVGFFDKVRDAGIPLCVDQARSREGGHIGEGELRLPEGEPGGA